MGETKYPAIRGNGENYISGWKAQLSAHYLGLAWGAV
jgi:hypothetical protein